MIEQAIHVGWEFSLVIDAPSPTGKDIEGCFKGAALALAAGAKRKSRPMNKAKRLGVLWRLAVTMGLAICVSDRRQVRRGECLHCQLDCVAAGIG